MRRRSVETLEMFEEDLAVLEAREAVLRDAAQAAESALFDRLRELHGAGAPVPALEALDLLEPVPDDEDGGGDAVQAP
jgi:hypothetical protein